MKNMTPLCIAIALAMSSRARAQTAGDVRAFVALSASNIGALTPLLTPGMTSQRLNGAQLGVRYGLRDEGNVKTHALAVSGIFSVGLASSLTLTAGITDADCNGCSAALMLGFGGDMRILDAANAFGDASQLTIALSGDVAYAQIKPADETAIALGVGAPITVSFGATPDGMHIAPFFTPMFGVGSASRTCAALVTNCETSGTRWVMGGGVGFWNPSSSVSVTVGLNQVMLSGSKTVYGINVQLGGK